MFGTVIASPACSPRIADDVIRAIDIYNVIHYNAKMTVMVPGGNAD